MFAFLVLKLLAIPVFKTHRNNFTNFDNKIILVCTFQRKLSGKRVSQNLECFSFITFKRNSTLPYFKFTCLFKVLMEEARIKQITLSKNLPLSKSNKKKSLHFDIWCLERLFYILLQIHLFKTVKTYAESNVP